MAGISQGHRLCTAGTQIIFEPQLYQTRAKSIFWLYNGQTRIRFKFWIQLGRWAPPEFRISCYWNKKVWNEWNICTRVSRSKTLHEIAAEKVMNSCHGSGKKAVEIGFCWKAENLKKVLTACVESGVRRHEVTVNQTRLAPPQGAHCIHSHSLSGPRSLGPAWESNQLSKRHKISGLENPLQEALAQLCTKMTGSLFLPIAMLVVSFAFKNLHRCIINMFPSVKCFYLPRKLFSQLCSNIA